MQAIWSRSIRPQSTCRCISCRNPLPSTLSRRSTTGIARKRLTACDAFSLLLGPVLGGAFIADTKAKEKRRREWDEKIAVVQAEVEQIRQTGFKPYSLRSRTLTRLPALRRNYSIATGTSFAIPHEEVSIGDVDVPPAPESHRHDQKFASIPAANSHDLGTDQEAADFQSESKLDQKTIERCKRLQRLVAIKLAIRMILHIHIGKSPRYVNTRSDYVYDDEGLPQDANELIRHLKQVRNSLKVMNSDRLRSSWRAYQSLTRGITCSLDREISDLARQFRRGEMSVTQLVERFAGRLLSSSDSPTVRGYVPLLTVLSRARFDELGFMIDGTMMEARLSYDRHTIFTLIWQYGKNKEAHYFDKLIKKLTTDNANAQFGEQWLWKNIDGILVPVPPSQDPQILQILIYAALKCNQPHRAEAWSTILSYTRTGNMWFSHVIRNFLRYYSAHKNWHKGQVWMQSALDRAEMLASQGIRHVQRITFAILEFCVAYGERALYRDVLKAACECRLGVYSADPDLTLTQRSRDILKEWGLRHGRVQDEGVDLLSSVEKTRMFNHKLQHIHILEPERTVNTFYLARPVDSKEQVRTRMFKSFSAKNSGELEADENPGHKGSPHISTDVHDESETVRWKALCHQQAIQLASLRHQLESLKSVQEMGFGSSQSDAAQHATDNVKDGMLHGASRLTVERGKEPGTGSTNQATSSSQPPLPDQPFSNVFSTLASHTRRQHRPPSRFSPIQSEETITQPSRSPTVPKSPTTTTTTPSVIISSHASPRHPSKPAPIPLRRTPTLHQIDLGLNFCAHITARLAIRLKESPSLPINTNPLYTLVSTLPHDLLTEITLDGFFAHFIWAMLTEWEEEVYGDKLVVLIGRPGSGRVVGESGPEDRGGEEGKAGGDEEEEREAPRLRITRGVAEVSPGTQVYKFQKSRRRRTLPLKKVGYGALRIQIEGREMGRAVL